MERIFKSLFLFVFVVLAVSCGNQDSIKKNNLVESIIQGYNPENLDILWVIDDRSPLNYIRTHLTNETSLFFQRLDQTPRDYRMAFTNVNDGRLLPNASTLLTPNVGTIADRTNLFSSFISQVINLNTAAWNRGFQSAYNALLTHFAPRLGVPLVLVFISDTDDYSQTPNNIDSVAYYSNLFLQMKGNQANLVRAYSINYRPLVAGETINPSNRCTTNYYNADIDRPEFKDSYYRMATVLGGSKADLCSTFNNQIDLTGLRLTELPKEFTLKGNPSKIIAVTVTDTTNHALTIPWFYIPETRKLVFQTAPPEGAAIQVVY
jgi:hypothetical protein